MEDVIKDAGGNQDSYFLEIEKVLVFFFTLIMLNKPRLNAEWYFKRLNEAAPVSGTDGSLCLNQAGGDGGYLNFKIF